MISSVFIFMAMHTKIYLLTYCIHKASIWIPLQSSTLLVSLLIKSQDILGVGLNRGSFCSVFLSLLSKELGVAFLPALFILELKFVNGRGRMTIWEQWHGLGWFALLFILLWEHTHSSIYPLIGKALWDVVLLPFPDSNVYRFGLNQHIGESYTNWICLIHMQF